MSFQEMEGGDEGRDGGQGFLVHRVPSEETASRQLLQRWRQSPPSGDLSDFLPFQTPTVVYICEVVPKM